MSILKRYLKKLCFNTPLLDKACKVYLKYRQSKVMQSAGVDAGNNPLVCYRIYGNHYERLQPLNSTTDAPENLSEELIQQPAIVKFKGNLYDMTRPGVYRFFKLPTISEQRLVGTNNFDDLSQYIGHIWSYGFEKMLSDNTSPEASHCHKRILVAGCADIAHIAKAILEKYNVDSRVIAFQTLRPWGGQDDGHTLLEVYDENHGWFCYDPSFGTLITDNGKRLRALDIQNYNNKNNNFNIELLPRSISHSAFRHSNYDYGFWSDEKYHSMSTLLNWYKDIGHVALYFLDGSYLFSREGVTSDEVIRLTNKDYCPIPRDEIKNKFYEKNIF